MVRLVAPSILYLILYVAYLVLFILFDIVYLVLSVAASFFMTIVTILRYYHVIRV